MQPAPFLIFIIDSRTWIVKHKNIAILASQILLPAPRADMHRAALLFVGFYGILLAERRCPTKRRRLLLLTGLAVLLFGAKQAREGNFLEFRSRRSQRREGCLMTTSEILLLFQTIIALLALLVSVVHLMDDRKKDDSYGSKRKKHKKK